MTKKNLEIHSENILPIIKKWLYSEKDIFIRELISNSSDAIQKVKILSDNQEIKRDLPPFQINITIDKDAKTLKISDNGIGMDEAEVQKYIAQIAFSGAEDFVHQLEKNGQKEQFIGHFGLGFYSSYMVASKVEIETLSYKEGAKPVFWSCDGSSEYQIEEGTKTIPGTTVTLYLDKENEEYLEESHLNALVKKYCGFLAIPLFVEGKEINTVEPLWIKKPSDCTEEDYLNFYQNLYPMNEPPLFWVHLNVDYPFHLKGILYFPKLKRNEEPEKNRVKLYCNRIFVSDNCKDIIPNYLMALEGIIDSPDIPLNVSRSYLQMDKTVRQLSSHISKKVADSLSNLYKNEKERFLKSWEDLNFVVKLGILEDEKFYERAKDFLVWKIKGIASDTHFATLQEYQENNREKIGDKVIYANHENHLSSVLDIYKEKGIEVLVLTHPIDSYVIQSLERKMEPLTFQRVDAAVEEHLVDKSRETEVVDSEGKLESSNLAAFIENKLADQHVKVIAKSLHNDTLPGFIMIDEKTRRMRDYMMQMGAANAENFLKFSENTFVVNTNSPLIQAIRKINEKDSDLAKELLLQTYDLSLLSQNEMTPDLLKTFISRSNKVLSELTEKMIS